MTYPLTDIDGVDADVVALLKKAGIRSSARLLEKASTLRGRRELAAITGIGERDLLRWANMADRMRIKGVHREYAELLCAAGVDTIRELAYRNPQKLAQAMAKANEKRKLVRLLPSDKAVTRWIDHAKKLPIKISY
jgi:hypothetical protein